MEPVIFFFPHNRLKNGQSQCSFGSPVNANQTRSASLSNIDDLIYLNSETSGDPTGRPMAKHYQMVILRS
jgi:hypothetical protein